MEDVTIEIGDVAGFGAEFQDIEAAFRRARAVRALTVKLTRTRRIRLAIDPSVAPANAITSGGGGATVRIRLNPVTLAFLPATPKSKIQVFVHELTHVIYPGAAPGNNHFSTVKFGRTFFHLLAPVARALGVPLGGDDAQDLATAQARHPVADLATLFDPTLEGVEIAVASRRSDARLPSISRSVQLPHAAPASPGI